MFGLGVTELIIVAVILVLFFGATRIPAIGRGLGQSIGNFRRELRGGDPPEDEQS